MLEMKKGQKFWYLGELATYKYYSTKYDLHHVSTPTLKDTAMESHRLRKVLDDQEGQKNWKPAELDLKDFL